MARKQRVHEWLRGARVFREQSPCHRESVGQPSTVKELKAASQLVGPLRGEWLRWWLVR